MRDAQFTLQPRRRNRHYSALFATLACVAGVPAALARAGPLNPLDFPSLGTITFASGSYSIDTTASPPRLLGPGVDLKGAISPSGVAVFRFDDLTVGAGAVLTAPAGADDAPTRPVAFLASGHLTFAGAFDASGASGAPGTTTDPGRGGVGRFGGSPGAGGVSSKPGGVGGAAHAVAPNLQLAGGASGGGGLTAGPTGGGGGGGGAGGGAVELGALGTLNLTGSVINVNGGLGGAAGYRGERDGGAGLAGGGGGGAAGTVLLHAATIVLGGTIDARAGNGGIGRGNGDDGAGGRVAIQATVNPGMAGISVAGGTLAEAPKVGEISFAQPALVVSTLDFGAVPVGSSITAAMSLQSSGQSGSFVNGQFPTAAPPFARVGTGIFSAIKAGDTTTCEYTFAPTTPGPVSEQVEVLTNAGPVRVTIRGVGVAAAPIKR